DMRCSPRHTNSVLHPVVDLLQRMLRQAEPADESELLDRVERLVGDSGLELGHGVPVVPALIGLPLPDGYPPLPASPEVLKERTRSVPTMLLLRRAPR